MVIVGRMVQMMSINARISYKALNDVFVFWKSPIFRRPRSFRMTNTYWKISLISNDASLA